MSYDKSQFENLITRALNGLDLYSPEALQLLLGTSAQESAFGTYLVQINGPAKGPFQMEPDTEVDIWENYLEFRPALKQKLVVDSGVTGPDTLAMETNLIYSIDMARIHYLRRPNPIPLDLEGQAGYWKLNYNTLMGKGTIFEYMDNYRRYCG